MVDDLPSLEHFTRDELVELVGILHRSLRKADEAYVSLAGTTEHAIEVARTAIDWNSKRPHLRSVPR